MDIVWWRRKWFVKQKIEQEKEPTSQQNIEPFNVINFHMLPGKKDPLEPMCKNLNGKKKNVDLFLKLRDFSREGSIYKEMGSQESRHGIGGKTSKQCHQDKQECYRLDQKELGSAGV